MALAEPMALHAFAYQQRDVAAAIALYAQTAGTRFAPAAWNLYLHHSELGDDDAAVH